MWRITRNLSRFRRTLPVRNIARLYPYDVVVEENDESEKTLRGSVQEIADRMQEALQERVDMAGIVIEDVKITNLAYSEEIAAAMLQRQQGYGHYRGPAEDCGRRSGHGENGD